MQDRAFQDFPTYVQKSSPKFNPFLFLFVIVALAFMGGGGYYLFQMTKEEAAKASPVPNTPKPTVMISPTMSASVSGSVTPTSANSTLTSAPTSAAKELDRSKLQIAILNGSGTAGAAKGISSHLEQLGYSISSVGNADNFDYQGITVKVKKNKSDYLSLLKKDLAENDSKVTITTKIDDTIETDGEVIVGK